MRYWQIVLVSEDGRPPGYVKRTLGLPALDEGEALAETLVRVGPAAYGSRITVTEIDAPETRPRG